MDPKFSKYKSDLETLLSQGRSLAIAIEHECFPERVTEAFKALLKDKPKECSDEALKEAVNATIKELPSFLKTYQAWYSEAKILIKQLLPDRLDDFVRHYEKPKSRKDITFENYRIEDFLQGLEITKGYRIVADKSAALPGSVPVTVKR